MKYNKGSIIDIYPEGRSTFRACIVLDYEGEDLVSVCNLDNGDKSIESVNDIDEVVIDNINTYDEG